MKKLLMVLMLAMVVFVSTTFGAETIQSSVFKEIRDFAIKHGWYREKGYYFYGGPTKAYFWFNQKGNTCISVTFEKDNNIVSIAIKSGYYSENEKDLIAIIYDGYKDEYIKFILPSEGYNSEGRGRIISKEEAERTASIYLERLKQLSK